MFSSFFGKCHNPQPTMLGKPRQSKQTMTSRVCLDSSTQSTSGTTPYFKYDFLTNGYNLNELIRMDPLTAISTAPADLSSLHTAMKGINMTNTDTSISIPQNGQYLTFPKNNFSYQIDIDVENNDDIINETRRLKYEHDIQYRYVSGNSPTIGYGVKQNYNSQSSYPTRTRAFYFDGNTSLSSADRQQFRYPCIATHGLPQIERTGKHVITVNVLHDYIDDDGNEFRRTQFIWDDVVMETFNYPSNTDTIYDATDPFFTLAMRGAGSGLSTYTLQAIRVYDKIIPTEELMIPFVSQDNFTKCYTTLSDTFVQVNSTVDATLLKFLNVDGYIFSTNTVIDGLLDLHKLDVNPLYFEFQMYVPPLTTTMFHFGNFVSAQPTNNVDFSLHTGLFWGTVNRQYCLRIGDYEHTFSSVSDPDNRTTWSVYLTLDDCKFYHDNLLRATVLKIDHPYFWDYMNISVAGQGFINRVTVESTGDTEIENVMKMAHTNLSQYYPQAPLIDRTMSLYLTVMPSISNNATVMNDLRFYKQDGTELDYTLVLYNHEEYIIQAPSGGYTVDTIKTTLTEAGSSYVIWRFYGVDAPADQQVIFDTVWMTVKIPRDAFRMTTQFNDTSRTPSFRIEFEEEPLLNYPFINTDADGTGGLRDTYFTVDGTSSGVFGLIA
jgi:hypothetical protein